MRWSEEGGEGRAAEDLRIDEGVDDEDSAPWAKALLAPAGAALGVGLFLLTRAGGGVSLEELAQTSVPLDEALSNGKPTVVEFYADWCEVCKSLTGETSSLRDQYKGKVNYVMLNIENPKWAQEVSEYHVAGIPHFEFLDATGASKGFVVGNLPQDILQADAEALARGGGGELPYVRYQGARSDLRPPGGQAPPPSSDSPMPRDHN